MIPQFTNASQDARKNSLTSQLQTIRSQIELYKLQHQDRLPDVRTAGTGWTLLTQKTTMQGTVTSAGSFGPYLQQVPTNPLNLGTEVVQGTGAANVLLLVTATGGAGVDDPAVAAAGGSVAPSVFPVRLTRLT